MYENYLTAVLYFSRIAYESHIFTSETYSHSHPCVKCHRYLLCLCLALPALWGVCLEGPLLVRGICSSSLLDSLVLDRTQCFSNCPWTKISGFQAGGGLHFVGYLRHPIHLIILLTWVTKVSAVSEYIGCSLDLGGLLGRFFVCRGLGFLL